MPTMRSQRFTLRSRLERDEDGTAIGNGPEADQVMLEALEQTLANLPSGGIGVVEYVDFFGRVTSSDGNSRLVTSNPLVIHRARI